MDDPRQVLLSPFIVATTTLGATALCSPSSRNPRLRSCRKVDIEMTTRKDTPELGTAEISLPAAGSVRLGIVSDIHLGGSGHDRWHDTLDFAAVEDRFITALKHFRRLRADAVMLLGDLAHHGDETSLLRVRQLAGEFGGPVRVVAGNHDRSSDNHTFEAVFASASSMNASVAAAGERVSELHGLPIVGIAITSDDAGRNGSASHVGVADWASALTVVLSHYPVLKVRDQLRTAGVRDSGELSNAAPSLADLRARRAPTLVLNGHLHARLEVAEGPLLQLSVAALVEPPHEATIVDIVMDPKPVVTVHRFSIEQRATESSYGTPILAPHESRWMLVEDEWVRHEASR